MNLRNAAIIMKKDIDEMIKTRYVLMTLIMVPLIFSIVLPVSITQGIGSTSNNTTVEDLAKMGIKPVEGMSPTQQMFGFLINNMMFLFFIIPLAAPSVIGSYSMVGEKLNKSLEPLLATPVEDGDIMAGKVLASVVPSVAATILAFALFVVVVNVQASSLLGSLFLPGPAWLIAVLLVSPALCFLSTILTLILSSRMNDIRSVQQISAMLVMPIMGIFVLSMTGVNLSSPLFMLSLFAIVAAIDGALFKAAKKLFQREEILTKWK